jgi:hypothetical protein
MKFIFPGRVLLTQGVIKDRWAKVGHGVMRPTSDDAFMLIECLVYISVLLILLGVGYAAFYRCMENSLALRRSTDDLANALHAGERWRADLRAATGPIRLERSRDGSILVLPNGRGEVAYQFTTNAVLRRVSPRPWTTLLERVKSSTMTSDPRPNVTAWRWELELQPRSRKPGRVRPLFTFIGAAKASSTK